MMIRVPIPCSPGEFLPGKRVAVVRATAPSPFREVMMVIAADPRGSSIGHDENITIESLTVDSTEAEGALSQDLLGSSRIEWQGASGVRLTLPQTIERDARICLTFGREADAGTPALRFRCTLIVDAPGSPSP